MSKAKIGKLKKDSGNFGISYLLNLVKFDFVFVMGVLHRLGRVCLIRLVWESEAVIEKKSIIRKKKPAQIIGSNFNVFKRFPFNVLLT